MRRCKCLSQTSFLVLCLTGAVAVFCLHKTLFFVITHTKKDLLTSTIYQALDASSYSTIDNRELYDSDILLTVSEGDRTSTGCYRISESPCLGHCFV